MQVDESPDAWLHRLMNVQRDGSQEGTSSLKDIFPEAYCRTLFLPATSPKHLKNLDQLDREDLTDDYKRDLSSVVAHLRDSLLRQRVRNAYHLCTGTFTSLPPPSFPFPSPRANVNL